MHLSTRILIVEDEVITAREIGFRLEELGYPVPEAVFSAEAAVERAAAARPDIILMDIHMAGPMDGIAAAGQIRAELDIPIIYITACADEQTLRRARQTEPFGYIVKPFGEPELRATLEMALAKHEAEKRLKAALAERDLLLKEINHRVKNNLQTLIYLMEMQEEAAAEPAVARALSELKGRVRSLALVHDQLYRTPELGAIDFRAYVRELVFALVDALGGRRDVRLEIEAARIRLPIQKAIPCGLIVNELVTNALRHAFAPDARRFADGADAPRIRLEFEKLEKDYLLTISDNGAGMPANLDWRRSRSLGLKLVNVWATYQLRGTLCLEPKNGTRFAIRFPE